MYKYEDIETDEELYNEISYFQEKYPGSSYYELKD